MENELTLSASLEDYLEAIFHISSHKQAAKAKDIAERLHVRAASVTGALRQLAERGLVNYAPYDLITLTATGRKAAESVVQRHAALKDFLVRVLSVDEASADEAACQMEHAVTKDILVRLTRFIQFVDNCPRAGSEWIHGFGYLCDEAGNPDHCEACILQSLDNIKNKKGEKGMEQYLKDLAPGDKARIERLSLSGDIARRFAEMGLSVGSVVKVERVAPLGDPVEISVRGYKLTLRKKDLERVVVSRL